jgi:hypothetical protein
MGYSTPKKPFDLKEFLAETPKRRSVRWNRPPVAPAADEAAAPPPEPDVPEPDR